MGSARVDELEQVSRSWVVRLRQVEWCVMRSIFPKVIVAATFFAACQAHAQSGSSAGGGAGGGTSSGSGGASSVSGVTGAAPSGAAPTPSPSPNAIAPTRPGLTGQPQSPSTPANPGQQAAPGVPQPTGPSGATQQPSTTPNSVNGGPNIGAARNAGRGQIGSVNPGTKPGSESYGSGTRSLVADCMALWDRGTHMTKLEWRRTCQRTKNALDQLPN